MNLTIDIAASSSLRETAMKYHSESSDEILLQGCLAGERLAQKYLYQRYYGRMMGIGMRYARNRDEAMSIVNNGFMKVFSSLKKYEGKGSLEGWIAKVMLYTAIDWLRSQTTYRKIMQFDDFSEGETLNEAISQLATEEIYAHIQQLPDASRLVFSLYAIEGYSHKEIAGQLGISVGTSKWHLSNARKILQKRISSTQSGTRS